MSLRSTMTAAVAACVALLVLASTASAQGFYYKEIVRDGRIYVFNIATEVDRFEKTGQMTTGLTRPGVGPKGETVVADSARALQLFFFKHGISEVVPEPAPPTMRIEWRDGKTRITTQNAYLEMSNRVQVRFTHDIPPDTVTLSGAEEAGDHKGSFRIRRAKFKLEGWFWKQNNLTYEVQLNWPAVSGSNPGAVLEDANIAWDPKGTGTFRVVFGQFKVPSFRQQLTSSGNQQFVDRSNASDQYARGRDTGVAIQGVLGANTLEYRLGMFNGNGLTQSANDNDTYQYNARLMWQPNGSQAMRQRAWVSGALYSEADFESTTTPIYAFALNVESNDFFRTTTGNDLKSIIVSADAIYKFRGLFLTAEYFWRQRDDEGPADEFNSDGWYLQGGQMLNAARTWEIAARYGTREVNDTIANDDVREMRVGLNYYYQRHALKFQVDAGQVETEAPGGTSLRKDREIRAQAQFVF